MQFVMQPSYFVLGAFQCGDELIDPTHNTTTSSTNANDTDANHNVSSMISPV
jgi:hypothetical protein